MMKKEKHKPLFFIGISLQGAGRVVRVSEALLGTPAAAARLRPGDSIDAINGKLVASIEESAARLRRNNKIEIRRRGRSTVAHVRGIDVRDQREVAQLLIGKGDKVSGLGRIYLFKHCDAKCDCVDGGRACDTWYTFEGEGPNGGVLLERHCRSLEVDLDTLKTKWVERKCQHGPDEYI